MSACQHCTAPITNGLELCKRCQQTARSALENIGSYHGELLGIGSKQRIRTKRSGVSDPTGTTAARELDNDTEAETPADLAAAARSELIGWMRRLDDGEVITASVLGAIRALQRDIRTIANQPWAGEFVHDIIALERRMQRVIERSKGSWYAGTCGAVTAPERIHDGLSCACACHNGSGYACDIDGGCGLEFGVVIGAETCQAILYVTPGHRDVRCKVCGTIHDAKSRRDVLLAEMRDTMLPLTTIAHVCVAMLDGEPSVAKFRSRLENWSKRGHLIWAGNDGPTKLYRIGDVLDLQIEHARDPRGWIGRKKAV